MAGRRSARRASRSGAVSCDDSSLSARSGPSGGEGIANLRSFAPLVPETLPARKQRRTHAFPDTLEARSRDARPSGRGSCGRGRSRLRLGRYIPGRRARLCRRQHGRDEHDRGVRPARGRHADPRARVPVPGRRRRHRRRARLPGRTATVRRRPVPARRRRRQQPDLGAPGPPRRLAQPGPRRRRLLRRHPARQHRGPRHPGLRGQLRGRRTATTPASGSPGGHLLPIARIDRPAGRQRRPR